MDLSPFKQDIDELVEEFVQSESTTLNDMKRIWLSRKFSYIYDASPSTNLAFFMQSLYSHAIGYIVNVDSLYCRLGGLYCLYCLYETQPFKPPFKIYLSLDLNEGSVSETINNLTALQDMRIKVAYEKLFADTEIEQYLQMDLGTEVDLDELKKKSTEYAAAKKQAIEEASGEVDVQNIKHISENKESLGEIVEKIDENWKNQIKTFYQQTGLNQRPRKEEQPLQLDLHENEQDNDVADEVFRLLDE
ncbi:Small nuclear RNA activating complex (SNAPc), subunit SNAP43 [Corchorus olitorius]|uniref:Small nuclear RNA activating complex (SNAPc), subunit SNAP43 n=1 Tax=Corchorus olitorius TaxID=93759 RepID=A0A1R3GI23_9ROSI|nr:Small nuclear RNA activating complex (SNAPc), subunit SNAP43 [Corchorus olitorius]